MPEVLEDAQVCLEVQIAGPLDSGKARGCESYQGFGFNPSDDAPEARRGVCHFFIYVKQVGALSPNTCSFKGLCPYGSCRFLGGLGQAGMNAGTNWVVLVSEL